MSWAAPEPGSGSTVTAVGIGAESSVLRLFCLDARPWLLVRIDKPVEGNDGVKSSSLSRELGLRLRFGRSLRYSESCVTARDGSLAAASAGALLSSGAKLIGNNTAWEVRTQREDSIERVRD